MKTLEQLIADWQEGRLSSEELAQLKESLTKPAARSELAAEWLLDQAISDCLRSESAQAAATARATAPTAARPRGHPARGRQRGRFFPWLVWREKQISLGWAAGVGVAVCLVVLGTIMYLQNAAVGRLETTLPQLVLERDGNPVPTLPGQVIYPNDTLVLSPEASGPVTLILGSGLARFNLAPGAEVRFERAVRGHRVALRNGTLQAEVQPLPRWRPLILSTPQATATVVGTRFTLSVIGGSTRLAVLEGAVRLKKTLLGAFDSLAEVTVKAGQTAAASLDSKLELATLTGFLSSDRWSLSTGIPLSEAPTRGIPLNSPGAPEPAGARSVERLRGFLLAPASGDFTFFIASLDWNSGAELWLSSDERPSHKRLIAQVVPQAQQDAALTPVPRPGSSAAMQADWLRSPLQKSPPCQLTKGQRYYIELYHQGIGLQSLALGWIVPGQPSAATPTMVDINALSPFVQEGGATQKVQ